MYQQNHNTNEKMCFAWFFYAHLDPNTGRMREKNPPKLTGKEGAVKDLPAPY